MTAQERVFEAFRALGVEVGYQDANKWIKKKYGDGVSDATFYNSRKVWRERFGTKSAMNVATSEVEVTPQVENNGEKAAVSVQASESLGAAQPVAVNEITLADLQKVNNFANEVGGRARLSAILAALDTLTAS